MKFILDIENNGLQENIIDYSQFPYKLKENAKLWVVSILNVKTNKKISLVKEEITKERLKEELKDCTELITHNGLKFDLPILFLFGVFDYEIGFWNKPSYLFGKECKFIDTLVWSRLFYPDRFGGHSLEAWGKRVGVEKIAYRQLLINKGKLDKHAPKGAEFHSFFPEMIEYCEGDTNVTYEIYKELESESKKKCWQNAVQESTINAHLSVFRENFGFGFDYDLALSHLNTLTKLMDEKRAIVNPLLPPKPMNIGELKDVTPPKNQLIKENQLSANIQKFAKKHGAEIKLGSGGWQFYYKDKIFNLPFTEPIETHVEPDIDDLTHVKSYLIELGWEPTEFRQRNLLVDAKKQNLSIEKRIVALDRWWKETQEGKFKKHRIEWFEDLEEHEIYSMLKSQLNGTKPVWIPTSPPVRVGLEKSLCPNLIKLGENVAFAKDFAEYLTYKHRKSCIAGGDIEDMDFDEETPNTGYLSSYRKVDGRIPTPAIEIGTSTNRYKHISVKFCCAYNFN